jgi:hypothetical protein
VRLEQRDLSEPEAPGPPIEFLFIDAMKSWPLAQSIVKSFLDYVNAGKLFFLLERGFYESALQKGRALFEAGRELPPNLVAGMANLMSTYRRRAASETASQDETSIGRVEAIEKLILQASSADHKN